MLTHVYAPPRQFLERNPEKRLGHVQGEEGQLAIKKHPFYAGLDWVKLAALELVPPFKPKLSKNPTEHFDPEFTAQDPKLTPIDDEAMRALEEVEQELFDGFSYVNPYFVSRQSK